MAPILWFIWLLRIAPIQPLLQSGAPFCGCPISLYQEPTCSLQTPIQYMGHPAFEYRGPEDHMNIMILQTMISGIPLIVSLGTRCRTSVDVISWALMTRGYLVLKVVVWQVDHRSFLQDFAQGSNFKVGSGGLYLDLGGTTQKKDAFMPEAMGTMGHHVGYFGGPGKSNKESVIPKVLGRNSPATDSVEWSSQAGCT